MEVNNLFQGILVLFIEEAHLHLAASTETAPHVHRQPARPTCNTVNHSPKQDDFTGIASLLESPLEIGPITIKPYLLANLLSELDITILMPLVNSNMSATRQSRIRVAPARASHPCRAGLDALKPSTRQSPTTDATRDCLSLFPTTSHLTLVDKASRYCVHDRTPSSIAPNYANRP